MRIALLADVHANLPALKAVLAHAEGRKVDQFWDLGDMVGYGPYPSLTINCLRKYCTHQILGNHDEKCTTLAHAERMRARGGDKDKIFSFTWTCQSLTAQDVRFIHALPRTLLVRAGGHKCLLTHGSPAGIADSLTPRTAAGKFRSLLPYAETAGVDVVVCGHTHEFFDRTFAGVRFINPGGIGRSFDGDTRASYVILDLAHKKVRGEHFRVPYDVMDYNKMLLSLGFSQRHTETFSQARNIEELDGVKEKDVPALIDHATKMADRYLARNVHVRQVLFLAQQIFDGVAFYFGLGWRERAWLSAAALLHDIGWAYGATAHHKTSRDVILADTTLPLSLWERRIVALLARYHRRSCPKANHAVYKDLNPYEQETVGVLAGILRIADGLDRSHDGRVAQLRVVLGAEQVVIHVKVRDKKSVQLECNSALMKADLLQSILGRRVCFAVE